MAETMKLTVDTGAVQVDVEDKDRKKRIEDLANELFK